MINVPNVPPVIMTEHLDPNVWGPHYWFFLHTVTLTYPEYPNDITRRKYYDLIMNMPLFIPNPEIGNHFAELLDKYPVTPYLENRYSFQRWVFFTHNKISTHIGKPEIGHNEADNNYFKMYQPKQRVIRFPYLEFFTEDVTRTSIIIFAAICLAFLIGVLHYKKWIDTSQSPFLATK